MICSLLRNFALAMLFCLIIIAQPARAQISFTGTGPVSEGSPVSGVLTDAEGDSVGYSISTIGPLFFGWNTSAASELGGIQGNFGSTSGSFDWIFTMAFDRPVESLTLSQTPLRTAGGNAGGFLAILTDSNLATVDAGTQGLGPDGLSNLGNVFTAGGDLIATLAPTANDEDDWSVDLNNVQNVTVRYQPTSASPAVVEGEWLTFSDANIAAVQIQPVAIPEPSVLLGLGCLLATTSLRRRRVR